ncbi:hypothetical protein GIB67_012550 [Kingdonia uniflora]|uniref:Uncharacterized protein n=1 Tax=Kingdonia uniflora TaxID=39325 RepID=A0A7J7P189_9MAGN|nr:hypothetical protein GIB67_012550 [Kingdonia uniflora]
MDFVKELVIVFMDIPIELNIHFGRKFRPPGCYGYQEHDYEGGIVYQTSNSAKEVLTLFGLRQYCYKHLPIPERGSSIDMYWSSGGEIKLIVSESSIKQMVDEFVMCGAIGHIFVRQEQVEEVEEEYVEEPNDDDPHVNPVKEYLSGAPSECSTIEEDMDGGELGEEGLMAADDLYSDDIENMMEPTENNIILEVDSDWIAKMIEPELRAHQSYMPCNIQAEIWKQYGVKISYWVAWRGRAKALEIIHGNYNQSYIQVPQLAKHILNSNPGAIVNWMTGLRDLPVCQFVEKLHLKIVTLMFDWRKKAREWSVDDVVPRVKKLHESHKAEYQKYIYRGVIDSELGIASNICISHVLAPPLRRPPRRPKVTRVRAGDDERPGRKRNGYKCGKCRVFEHNARSCKGPPSSNVYYLHWM